MSLRSRTKARAAVLGQLAFFAVFATVAVLQPALADYAGKSPSVDTQNRPPVDT